MFNFVHTHIGLNLLFEASASASRSLLKGDDDIFPVQSCPAEICHKGKVARIGLVCISGVEPLACTCPRQSHLEQLRTRFLIGV